MHRNYNRKSVYGRTECYIGKVCRTYTATCSKGFLSENKIEVIDWVRQIVKILRTPTFKYSLQHLQFKKPRIDVSTRWNSTFDMLQRLLEHKDFCNENLKKSLILSEEEWATIQDIVKVLSPLKEATLKLQKNQLFLGDFYKLWLNLKLQLKTMNLNVAGVVLDYLDKRESKLLKNEAVNGALFLDPRFKRLLSSEQKAKATKHLKKIAAQMLLLKQGDRINAGVEEDATCNNGIYTNNTFSSTSSTSSCVLQDSIREMEMDSSSDDESENINNELRKVYYEIDNCKEKRVDINSDLMAYWKEKKYAIPHVAKLANIIHAVPATQASVERAFSALKLILDYRRSNLSTRNVERLMFMKLNTNFIN